MSIFNKDARKIYQSITEQSLPKDQLYIHDDELCPCGSEKLFIDCCKNKSDPGPILSRKPPEVIVMERFRNSVKKNEMCLYPDISCCKGRIKEAHALQNHKILSILAGSDNHVIMIDHTKQPIIFQDNQND